MELYVCVVLYLLFVINCEGCCWLCVSSSGSGGKIKKNLKFFFIRVYRKQVQEHCSCYKPVGHGSLSLVREKNLV